MAASWCAAAAFAGPIRRQQWAVCLTSAPMISPVSIPSCCPSATHHRAVDVAGSWGKTPRSRSATACGTVRAATQCRSRNQYVTVSPDTNRSSQQGHQSFSRKLTTCTRTRVARRTGTIQLSRSDACKPQPRPLGTPDWSVTVPDMGRSTVE